MNTSIRYLAIETCWTGFKEARYVCPECGNKVFRGVVKCNQCKANLDAEAVYHDI